MNDKQLHEGRNVKRIREMLGIKQEALALELGDDWNQKKISLLEQKEIIEPDLLEQVARALKIPTEAIKNFDEEKAINIFSNTYTTNDNSATVQGYFVNYTPNFNPLDKLLDAMEENKKLYERLLQSEREKVMLLEKMLDKK
jgi:transcriptional regulator with XRE-family HTH domain